MTFDWDEEVNLCDCKSSCTCDAYRNLPAFSFILELLELKNKKDFQYNENIKKDKCERNIPVLEN